MPPHLRPGPLGSLSLQLEEHWDTPAVQQQASVMLSSALKLATLASDTPTELLVAGQPMIVLLCARAVVRCMFDHLLGSEAAGW